MGRGQQCKPEPSENSEEEWEWQVLSLCNCKKVSLYKVLKEGQHWGEQTGPNYVLLTDLD